MKQFSELMSGQSLLPIIQANNPGEGVNIARAMANAGLQLVEVVLRTDSSLDALSAIKQEVPELTVGAGTVINARILDDALKAGADFIVTPASSPGLLGAVGRSGVPVLPGVSNTADILLALEYGFPEQKLFPASLSGGAAFLSAVSSVFRDVSFCPTGGINADNKEDYLKLPNVFAVGGTWVAKPEWIRNGNWEAVTNACSQALSQSV